MPRVYTFRLNPEDFSQKAKGVWDTFKGMVDERYGDMNISIEYGEGRKDDSCLMRLAILKDGNIMVSYRMTNDQRSLVDGFCDKIKDRYGLVEL